MTASRSPEDPAAGGGHALVNQQRDRRAGRGDALPYCLWPVTTIFMIRRLNPMNDTN